MCTYVNLQQSTSSEPSAQSILVSHHLSALIHLCEVVHLLSSEYGHGLEAVIWKTYNTYLIPNKHPKSSHTVNTNGTLKR